MRYIWEEKKDVLIDWRGGERQNLRMAPRFLARIVSGWRYHLMKCSQVKQRTTLEGKI